MGKWVTKCVSTEAGDPSVPTIGTISVMGLITEKLDPMQYFVKLPRTKESSLAWNKISIWGGGALKIWWRQRKLPQKPKPQPRDHVSLVTLLSKVKFLSQPSEESTLPPGVTRVFLKPQQKPGLSLLRIRITNDKTQGIDLSEHWEVWFLRLCVRVLFMHTCVLQENCVWGIHVC